MQRPRWLRLLLAVGPVLLAWHISARAQAYDENGIQTLTDYFDLLASGNFESAGYMWSQAAQDRSARFGIEYENIPLRVDCTSPIVRNLDLMRNYLKPPVKQAQNLEPKDYFRLDFSNLVKGRLVQHSYYVQRVGNTFWLIYPQDYFARTWPVQETKYFRIHVHPDRREYINSCLTEEADRSVERLSDSLGLTNEDLSLLAAKKIEYFYCPTDSSVLDITGTSTKGEFDEASNDIISSEFPHAHELAHLLVNLKLKQLPLSTLPLLREGLAVRYGGRWGKRASALMDLGSFLIKEKVVDVDSILTAPGFQSGAMTDIAYPVAGVFVSYLLQRMGQEKFYQLYRDLSADPAVLDTMNHIQLKRAFAQAVGVADWTALLSDLDGFITRSMPMTASAEPGVSESGKTILKVSKITIVQDKEWLSFKFEGNAETPVEGNLLFGSDPRLKGQASYLFKEQYGNLQQFDGYRYGVRFDTNEAGLYDYGTNELVAKYIWGVTPSEKYFNATDHTVSIRFKRILLEKVVPKDDDYKLLPM
ncbi:MAG TPA: hypothetical protein VMS71_03745 [Candidatus Acidoferrum sp.]|nr:hypothetical protein [Candidatus Acidoferrum sp.]